MDVLQAFSPLMNHISLIKPWVQKDSHVPRRISRWVDAPQELREKWVFVRRMFNDFVSEVDRGLCQRHVRTLCGPFRVELTLSATIMAFAEQGPTCPRS